MESSRIPLDESVNDSSEIDHLTPLCHEILLEIATHLDYWDILRLCRTAKVFYQLYRDNFLWKRLYRRDFLEPEQRLLPGINYREAYRYALFQHHWRSHLTFLSEKYGHKDFRGF